MYQSMNSGLVMRRRALDFGPLALSENRAPARFFIDSHTHHTQLFVDLRKQSSRIVKPHISHSRILIGCLLIGVTLAAANGFSGLVE